MPRSASNRFRIHKAVPYFVLLCALAALNTSAQAQAPAAGKTPEAKPGLEVVLLGTGIPLPNPERATASTLVVAGDRRFMVDTGDGSYSRLIQAGYNDVTAVLYTHYHSDHIADLGEVLTGRTINGAREPLPVFGPVGAQQVADGFQAAYALDTTYRVNHHGEKFSATGTSCKVRECAPGVIYDEEGLKITMFTVDHEPNLPAVGYRFDFNGTSVVISGDTKKCEKVAEMAKGCDILVHEAMNEMPLNALRRGLQRSDPRRAEMLYEAMNSHTSTLDVARIAKEAGVKKLVLTHLLPSIAPNETNEAIFIKGMSDIYQGAIIVGRDLTRITP